MAALGFENHAYVDWLGEVRRAVAKQRQRRVEVLPDGRVRVEGEEYSSAKDYASAWCFWLALERMYFQEERAIQADPGE
jgi:hypothetical protein